MKNSLIVSFAFVLASIFTSEPILAAQPNFGGDPLFHFVITEKRLWIVGEEFPLKNLDVKVFDQSGKVVLEKLFCSSTERWFLDLSQLPVGKYKVAAGNSEVEWMKK